MKIDLDPAGGGVLIQGTYNELDGLADTIAVALEDGHAEGNLLTDEGVETVTIQRLPGDDDE